MTQIASLKFTKDGIAMIDVPVWEHGTATTATQYELLGFYDGIEPDVGFIAFGTSGGPEATIEELKVEHSILGTLCPLSALAPACPIYTAIDSFSTSPGNFVAGNFTNLYGSPSSNFVQVGSPVATCGESGQSLRHETTTASTVFSNATYWTAAPGKNIELFANFTGTSKLYNIIIIYFGATSFSNTYRAMFDWGNSTCYLQNGGSTLTSAAITSRPTGQFCNLVVDYRNSDPALIQMDLLDDVGGTSLIGGPLTSTNTSHTGDRVGMYVKSRSGDPIYINALRSL